jgi:S1-C subfamily serine protease
MTWTGRSRTDTEATKRRLPLIVLGLGTGSTRVRDTRGDGHASRRRAETGRASHAVLGIQPADVTPEIARELGVKEARGVLVYAIEPGGPAASAGIQPGDVITAVAGNRVDNVEAFLGELRHHRPGDSVAVQLLPRRAEPPGDRQAQRPSMNGIEPVPPIADARTRV